MGKGLMQDNPLVSVIIPMYNCRKFIREAVESVLAQDLGDFEVVTVDDGSRDDTGEIVKEIAGRDKRIVYFRQENKGVSAARNKALELSRGKFIAFLDHDDVWLPTKLKDQILFFEKNPKVGLVYSNALYFNEKGHNAVLYGKRPPSGMIFGDLLMHPFLCISTVIVRRDALSGLEYLFDGRFHLGEELDVFLRILYKWQAAYADKILVKYRLHSGSYTSRNKKDIPWEKEIILEKLLQAYPQVETNFKHEFAYFRSRIQYDYALIDWDKGNNEVARSRLRPYVNINKKLLLPYLFSYLPYRFYKSFLALDRRNLT